MFDPFLVDPFSPSVNNNKLFIIHFIEYYKVFWQNVKKIFRLNKFRKIEKIYIKFGKASGDFEKYERKLN